MSASKAVQRTGWWRDAVVYQVWPKSFFSARGRPTGDIAGLIAKLDYIKALGANTVWLSPHYASPMVDEGYDISDYQAVNPMFGDVSDAERLIKECHARDMRLIFDLVINHSSDQHAWFKESRSSRDNPKRDWYIWRPARYDVDGKRMPPNNWSSHFSQSAWTWDELTQEYYLHLFCIEQPELNWTNEECRKTIYKNAIEFWLERGLDGFRIDTVGLYSKPMDFPDAPITMPDRFIQNAHELYINGPEMPKYLSELGSIFERYDAMTVGELGDLNDPDKVLDYVSFKRNALSMVFHLGMLDVDNSKTDLLGSREWKLTELKANIDKWQRFPEGNDGWTTFFLENHDSGRSVSRYGNPSAEHYAASAKMLCLFNCTMSGTPYIYQGQEIVMTNVPLEWDEKEYLDVNTINYLQSLRDMGKTEEEVKKAMVSVNMHARDSARTPVQWSAEENAGFTKAGVKPWMRVNDNYKTINVADQLTKSDSILRFWQKVLALRKAHTDIFTYGTFQLHDKENESVFTYVKKAKDGKMAVVLLNFSDKKQSAAMPQLAAKGGKVALSTHDATDVTALLLPYEGRVVIV